MSATVESPVTWRRARSSTPNQLKCTLLRSTSSQSNLAEVTSSSVNHHRGVATSAPFSQSGGSCLQDTAVCRSQSPVTIQMNGGSGCSKIPVFSGVIESLVRSSGTSGTHLVSQFGQFHRTFQVGSSSMPCRLLSNSFDRLTDVQSNDASTSSVLQESVVRLDVSTPVNGLKKAPCHLAAPTPCALGKPTANLACGVDVKNDTVPSVRPGLVAELLKIDSVLVDEFIQQLLILDCRPFVSYNSNHVRGALNVSCSDCITRKRLLTGRASLGDLVSGTDDAKDRYRVAISNAKAVPGTVQVVVYDDDTEDFSQLPAGHSLRLVVSCLKKALVDVYFMYGGLKAFYKDYSNLCSRPGSPIARPLSAGPSTPAIESCKIDNAKISQILPFLFIGNEHDAADRNLLKQLGINHIINVTSHVPLHFESDGIKYLRFPAADSGCENLRQYFDIAIQFIDNVQRANGGSKVLVHCQAGVSRSSTIVIAYVMARSSLSMLDAFRFVKSRRSIVAPNFNFLGQLLDFEVAIKEGRVKQFPELDVTPWTLSDAAVTMTTS